MNRRKFIKVGAASVALTALSSYAADVGDQKKRVGLIGCGWYGKCDLMRLIQVAPVEVVSLCDVDSKMLSGTAEMVASRQASKKTPRTYHDYREMLKEKDLDIVLVATPDHWHALAMIAAVQSGADIYVQKPISVDVTEGQVMVAAARKHKRVVQVGTQRRSTPHLIEARDTIVKEGKLGKVAHAEVFCYYNSRREKVPNIAPPESLDYEMWTGPAPMQPFNRLIHPKGWRSFMQYGNGIIGDMCIHMFDTVRWMLDLGAPKRISSSGGILMYPDATPNTPDTQIATFDFGEMQVVWNHRIWGEAPDPKYLWGFAIYGDKGTLKGGLMSYDFTPLGNGTPIHKDVTYELEEYPEDKTEKDLEKHVAPAIRGHMKNFLSCIGTREKPVADIEQGYISSTACILANMSLKLGRSIKWDNESGQIVGDDEANKMLSRPYRAPWVHPTAKSV